MSTPNTERYSVTIEGVEYELLLNFGAFCRAQDLTGRDYTNIRHWIGMGAPDLRALLFAAAWAADEIRNDELPPDKRMELPRLTLRQIDRLSYQQIQEVDQVMASAFFAALPPELAAQLKGEVDKEEGGGAPADPPTAEVPAA